MPLRVSVRKDGRIAVPGKEFAATLSASPVEALKQRYEAMCA
jgi:hypothetical protein